MCGLAWDPFAQSLRESAPVLAQLATGRDPEALRALAFLVRNRATWLDGIEGGRSGPKRPVVEAVRSLGLAPAATSASAELAFDALWTAFEGVARDPTHGATHVHPHGESPDWADGLRATALIGPYLFLAAPGR